MEQQQIKDTIGGLNIMLANRFQPALVSGENIKTVNNQSILGSGNLIIQDKPTTYSNIPVSVTPTKMSSYCA